MDNNYLQKVNMLVAGEQGLVVDFGNEISEHINMLVQQLARLLSAQNITGITEVVPTYRSVMVYFDPVLIARAELTALIYRALEQVVSRNDKSSARKVIHVPVCYGGVFGPDMDFVVRRTGLTMQEVIAIHTAKAYLVYMLGFTPGFPYLGGLPEALVVPRLEKIRAKIPEGSVGIAGRQTGFYTVASTGGWRIIGRTPIRAFNPEAANPFVFAAGDYLQFKAVSVDEFFAIRREVDAGTYTPEISFQ
ncbi:MAG: 5-oxoprolinase subunit PxpB [Negativicutes bacterium]|nr:5-oxoprolinase subunit PxpB [Negativicutes bacterium]